LTKDINVSFFEYDFTTGWNTNGQLWTGEIGGGWKAVNLVAEQLAIRRFDLISNSPDAAFWE